MKRHRNGFVATYDHDAGYGTVGDGIGRWEFHCTSIADGSRNIEPGTAVWFTLRPGRRGVWEADTIEPSASTDPMSPTP